METLISHKRWLTEAFFEISKHQSSKSLAIFKVFVTFITLRHRIVCKSYNTNNYYNRNFTLRRGGKIGCLGTIANAIDSFLMKMLVRCLVAYNKVGI